MIYTFTVNTKMGSHVCAHLHVYVKFVSLKYRPDDDLEVGRNMLSN